MSKWETYHWICQYHQQSLQISPADYAHNKNGLIAALEADNLSYDPHAALTPLIVDEWRTSFQSGPQKAPLHQALKHAEKAMRCDPENASAHEAMAAWWLNLQECGAFESTAQFALDMNFGHADTLGMIGFCYALARCAITFSPLYVNWYRSSWGAGCVFCGRAKEVLAELRRFRAPQQLYYFANPIWLCVEMNDMQGAIMVKIKF